MRAFILTLLVLSVGCKESDNKTIENLLSQYTATTSENEDPAVLPDGSSMTITQEFMSLIDLHRSQLGLNKLILDNELSDLVENHSDDMARGAVPFGHTGFSERCSEGRLLIGGGNWCGENVATGQKTPKAAYTSWINSPSHRANIESPKATHTGFGFKQNSSGVYYWTQIFIQRN